MKNLLLTLALVLSQAVLFAQDDHIQAPSGAADRDIRTLFKKPDQPVRVGYYFSPEFSWTRFDDRNVYLGGLSMGVIVDHFFSMGLAAYGIMNSRDLWYDNVDTEDTIGAYLYGGYGGMKMEFRIFPKAPVHLNFPILIGGGGLVYNTWNYADYHYDYENGTTLAWDAFFVVEPGMLVEINLVRFLRLDAGVTYRYTPDLDLMSTNSNLINNFNLNVSLKFGKF